MGGWRLMMHEGLVLDPSVSTIIAECLAEATLPA